MIIEIKFGYDLPTVKQNELRYRMELAAWKMAWHETELSEDYIIEVLLNIKYESIGFFFMSVKELMLMDEDLKINITNEDDYICFYTSNVDWLHAFRLDRNQAHLLMLYLQEHLK